MQTIAIVNQKGGVGKSTTAVNLGAGLVRQGKRVLLIDADSQANLTEMLGWQQPDELSPTLATMLEGIISDRPIEPQAGILHHTEGMDLLPANIELSGLEVSLVNTMSRETVLRTYLNEVKRLYDYILVDCSPSLGMLTLNALTAADRVIIPVQSHYLPVKGLEQLLRTVSKVQRQLNSNLKISGILITMTESRTNFSKEIVHPSFAWRLHMEMTLCVLTLVHVADTKEQLDADTDTIRSIAGGKNCEMSVLTYQQEDALNTVLPYGLRRIDTLRTLTTESAAGLVPFSSQEIRHRGGIYYGVNATSRNLIVCDRRQLLNSNGFILGVSGSGKSFAAKEEITSIALSTDDDIIIVDPEREYAPLVRALGGEVVQIAAGSHNHINAMDMTSGYGEEDDTVNGPLLLKSQFVMSLCEQLMKPSLIDAKERSIIARCVKSVYQNYTQDGTPSPTLKEFRAELLRQPEPQAQSIALALELFVDGTLDVFAYQTNVDMSSRIMLFDIFDLGSQLKTVGMLVMLDAILNRVIENHRRGRRTWIYIDEIYLFFANEYSTGFLEESWKRFRKKNAAATGITQNVTDCLRSPTAKNMLANSEFLLMLSQAPTDQEELVRMLRISEEQLGYINNAESGHGLIKVGGALVPFINQFPRGTALYRLMTTKPGESL